ncbi:MAG: winged helix-turn-helix transcriptional regulator, partial [Candidatus Thermoplasmatota archaeon]
MSAHEEKHNTNIHDESGKLYNETISSLCFIIPLYSKINESDLFKNATRANIYALIINKPGITFSSITRELKLENGTATHHIYILEREGYIKSKKTGKYRRYYQTGFKASGLNDIQDKIVSAIVENPGISQTEIAIKLDLSRQVVNFHLKGLISMEAIKLEKNGNKSNC